MLRSLYSGISGLRAHQTMLDVSGNNVANVNTVGFKSSAVQFQDTLSQLTAGGSAGANGNGGTNPAQVGLGVQVAGVTTNFAQGASQSTGKATDMMISGDGFFVTTRNGQEQYTRNGAFSLDGNGRLTANDGSLVQGWSAVNGQIPAGGAVGGITLSGATLSPAKATTTATIGGNLPSDAALGTELVREVEVFDASGTASSLSLTFTRTGAGWDVAGQTAAGATGTGALAFTAGKQAAPGTTINVGGIAVDLSTVTGFSGETTVASTGQNGFAAGVLESFTVSPDGTLVGSFSNGTTANVARVALASFTNPAGLEKAGGNTYLASPNSGNAAIGSAGTNGLGSVSAGALEMSNVDLSQEFTNLIVAQRGFQANSRIITTSDSVLEELVNLKR